LVIHFRRRDIPERELIADLRRVARKCRGRTVTMTSYHEEGAFGPGTLIRRFGSWNAALRTAGLNVGHQWGTSDRVLFENLAGVWRKLGRQPTGREMDKDRGLSRFSHSTYKARFDSWHKALRAFAAFVEKDSRIDGASLPHKAKRRPARRVSPGRTISWRLRATVLIRDNCLCRMCGASPAKDPAVTLHVDHIKPWSKGGATILGNLQTLCHTCNIGKGDLTLP
jgi:hypothetical protein